MTEIYTLEQIQSAIKGMDFSPAIEEGFVQYSLGNVTVPPVGELVFDQPPGDTHIKYGYIQNADTYVIKIASGFYDNPKLGLSSNSGLMLVFSQQTGFLKTILLDDGFLTDIRTAVAGRICAAYLAPEKITAIGVIGTGIQARMQVEYLSTVTPVQKVYVWGRSGKHALAFQADLCAKGYDVSVMKTPAKVAENCNLIITATPSKQPLLFEKEIKTGTHITAMGSDTSEKQELDPQILKRADILVADSRSKCRSRGEISRALAAGTVTEEKVIELGEIIHRPEKINRTENCISVADLTGVAVQDVQIATAVCRVFENKGKQGE